MKRVMLLIITFGIALLFTGCGSKKAKEPFTGVEVETHLDEMRNDGFYIEYKYHNSSNNSDKILFLGAKNNKFVVGENNKTDYYDFEYHYYEDGDTWIKEKETLFENDRKTKIYSEIWCIFEYLDIYCRKDEMKLEKSRKTKYLGRNCSEYVFQHVVKTISYTFVSKYTFMFDDMTGIGMKFSFDNMGEKKWYNNYYFECVDFKNSYDVILPTVSVD